MARINQLLESGVVSVVDEYDAFVKITSPKDPCTYWFDGIHRITQARCRCNRDFFVIEVSKG